MKRFVIKKPAFDFVLELYLWDNGYFLGLKDWKIEKTKYFNPHLKNLEFGLDRFFYFNIVWMRYHRIFEFALFGIYFYFHFYPLPKSKKLKQNGEEI